MILDAIKTALNDFIKCADENYHGMSCAAETLLNDIEGEYVPLYKMRKAWTEYQEPMRFDRWVGTYAEKRADLNESLNEALFTYKSFEDWYNHYAHNWLDCEESYDSLEDAFEAGLAGQDWDSFYNANKGSIEDVDYIEIAFEAGADLAVGKNTEDDGFDESLNESYSDGRFP